LQQLNTFQTCNSALGARAKPVREWGKSGEKQQDDDGNPRPRAVSMGWVNRTGGFGIEKEGGFGFVLFSINLLASNAYNGVSFFVSSPT